MTEGFPAIYYHATRVEFDAAIRKNARTTVATLDLIIRFYEAYEHNRRLFDARGVRGVEAHWKRYYENATKANRKRDLSGSETLDILGDGVRAHLTDLARTLREAFDGKHYSPEELRPLYFDMDPLFRKVARLVTDDIQAVRPVTRMLISLDRVFNIGANYLVALRREAWEHATGGSPLRARGVVPRLLFIDESSPCE